MFQKKSLNKMHNNMVSLCNAVCGKWTTNIDDDTAMLIVCYLSINIDELAKPPKNHSMLCSAFHKSASYGAVLIIRVNCTTAKVSLYIRTIELHPQTSKMVGTRKKDNLDKNDAVKPKRSRRVAAKSVELKENQNNLKGPPLKNAPKSNKVSRKLPVPEKSAMGIFDKTFLNPKELSHCFF